MMSRSTFFGMTTLVMGVALCALLSFPLISYAQAGVEGVSSVIRSSLLQDPRTNNLSQTELDAMVAVLAAASVEQGLTAEQILWHPDADVSDPTMAEMYVPEDTCTSWPPLCTFNAAFGFDDPNSLAPVIFGVTSIGMVWILAEVLHIRSRRQKVAA